jgi:copper chaperone CopZ
MTNDIGLKSLDLYLDGMYCQRCVHNVRRSLAQIDGVDSCNVEMGHARISYLPQLAGLEEIRRAVETAGYGVHFQAPRRNAWQRFLSRTIRSNENMFGGKPPECCTIIRDQKANQYH